MNKVHVDYACEMYWLKKMHYAVYDVVRAHKEVAQIVTMHYTLCRSDRTHEKWGK